MTCKILLLNFGFLLLRARGVLMLLDLCHISPVRFPAGSRVVLAAAVLSAAGSPAVPQPALAECTDRVTTLRTGVMLETSRIHYSQYIVRLFFQALTLKFMPVYCTVVERRPTCNHCEFFIRFVQRIFASAALPSRLSDDGRPLFSRASGVNAGGAG